MAKKPDDWMPMHIGDYLADTTHLNTLQHGAYVLLIFAYWRRGGPLPADDGQLSSIAKVTLTVWRKMRALIAAFFAERDGHWHHKRIDQELAKAKRLTDAKSEAGHRGAQKRWQTDGAAIAEPSISQWQNDAPLPLPVPKKEDDEEARARSLLSRICEILRITLTDDPGRLTWSRQVAEMLRDGIPEAAILQATEAARTRGIIHLRWIRSYAMDGPKAGGPKGLAKTDVSEALKAKWAAEDEQNRRVRDGAATDEIGLERAAANG